VDGESRNDGHALLDHAGDRLVGDAFVAHEHVRKLVHPRVERFVKLVQSVDVAGDAARERMSFVDDRVEELGRKRRAHRRVERDLDHARAVAGDFRDRATGLADGLDREPRSRRGPRGARRISPRHGDHRPGREHLRPVELVGTGARHQRVDLARGPREVARRRDPASYEGARLEEPDVHVRVDESRSHNRPGRIEFRDVIRTKVDLGPDGIDEPVAKEDSGAARLQVRAGEDRRSGYQGLRGHRPRVDRREPARKDVCGLGARLL
jgi:hypothetical protein